MIRIKELLEKSGCKVELIDSIVESLETYKSTVKESLQSEFDAKIEAAKKLCVEETVSYKRELARRLQIFCESKGAAIERQLQRQSALSESKAQAKLTQIHTLLEGVEKNSLSNGSAIAAVEKAKRQIKQLSEEKEAAIAKANRQTQIAEKALSNTRKLMIENAKLKNSNVPAKPKQQKVERLDESRTTKQPKARPARTITEGTAKPEFDVDSIAASIE